ncbi:NrdH-redoxin [Candidatus Saccharibacteria bacterium]|nr:NrdH-redoxin [Candidatus Saccharibacteria bacterium]
MSHTAAVTVYSTTWCGFCHQAKKYFDGAGIAYTDVDVEKDPKAAEEMVKKSNQMGVPVIEIGDTIIVGFDRPKVEAALKTSGITK